MYQHLEEVHNTRSAEIILPIVFEHIKPKSVLDVGCGLGTWLKVCKDLGVKEILGIDGNYVDMSKVVIPNENFQRVDLRMLKKSEKKYDLTICLEVAEHLPCEFAQQFVDFLTSSSDTILFSAAIPFQGGQGHINEQPLSYWTNKFKAHGFHIYDFIRPIVWNDERVDWWYKQNIILFSRDKDLLKNKNLPSFNGYMMVSPFLYFDRMKRFQYLIDTFGLSRNRFDHMSYEIPQNICGRLKLWLLMPIVYLKRKFSKV